MSDRYDPGTDNLLVELDDAGVLRIVLNNPERHNSLTGRMLGGLQRLFAVASDDPAVRAVLLRGAGDTAFASGADIHATTAATIFDVEPDAVDRQMRSRAKAINFGLLYGMGANRLARARVPVEPLELREARPARGSRFFAGRARG